jgi:hypothetical protein
MNLLHGITVERSLFKTLLETDQVLYYWECTNSSSIADKKTILF